MRALLFVAAGTAIASPTVKWGDLPLSFEPNRGQAASEIRYIARGSAYTLSLGPGRTVLAGHNRPALRTRFPGANLSATVASEAPQPSVSNYFIGSDPQKWHSAIPNFERVRYAGVYPGIDLVYYGKDGHLEYDWIISGGADPAGIRMVFENADRVRIDRRGDLVIRAGKDEHRHKRPLRRSAATEFWSPARGHCTAGRPVSASARTTEVESLLSIRR